MQSDASGNRLVFSMCVGCAVHLTNYHKARFEWNEVTVQLRAAAELEKDMFQRLLARWKILSAECQEHRDLYFGHVRGHGIA